MADEQQNAEADPHFSGDAERNGRDAWEEIEPGRYMPRRIRGSYKGRALG